MVVDTTTDLTVYAGTVKIYGTLNRGRAVGVEGVNAGAGQPGADVTIIAATVVFTADTTR
jgi:hypothetical protein